MPGSWLNTLWLFSHCIQQPCICSIIFSSSFPHSHPFHCASLLFSVTLFHGFLCPYLCLSPSARAVGARVQPHNADTERMLQPLFLRMDYFVLVECSATERLPTVPNSTSQRGTTINQQTEDFNGRYLPRTSIY